MCEGPKLSADAAEWTCSKCTLGNKGSQTVCEACSTPNSAAAKEEDYDVEPVSSLAGKIIALYFSAHWCGPCRSFTPQLASFYEEFKATDKGRDFEIVFVSSDRDDASFREYFGEMPWAALPYADRELKKKLGGEFDVQGIPTLVLLSPDGDVITSDGVEAVSEDPSGSQFPWRAKTPLEALDGAFVGKDGSATDLAAVRERAEYIGLYFSAHWCPPCRGFTPKLIKFYQELNKASANKLEVVFVSGDNDQESFDEYYGSMPWLAVPFNDDRIRSLNQTFRVEGIPHLVILDRHGGVVHDSAVGAVQKPDSVAKFPWPAQALDSFDPSLFGKMLNAGPLCVALAPAGTREDVVAAVRPLAEEHKARFDADKAANGKAAKPAIQFMLSEEKKDPIYGKLASMVGGLSGPILFVIDAKNQTEFASKKGDSITADSAREFVEQFLKGEANPVQ